MIPSSIKVNVDESEKQTVSEIASRFMDKLQRYNVMLDVEEGALLGSLMRDLIVKERNGNIFDRCDIGDTVILYPKTKFGSSVIDNSGNQWYIREKSITVPYSRETNWIDISSKQDPNKKMQLCCGDDGRRDRDFVIKLLI